MKNPLHHAAKNDNLSEILTLLLDFGIDREKRNKKGCTPLLTAARFCASENIQLLLRYNVAYDVIDCDAFSAFHHLINSLPSACNAASSSPISPRSPGKSRAGLGHINLSPVPSLVPSTSTTLATEPTAATVMSAIKVLLEAGADINMINNVDETCLDLLTRKTKKSFPCKNEVLLFLKNNGAKSGKDIVNTGKSKTGKLRGLLGL